MRHIIRTSLKQIASDRGMLLLLAGIFIGGIVYIVYVAFTVQPTDLQLAARYTSFGETQFYREKWWYLLGFVGIGLLFILAHISMVIKLYVIGMRPLAAAFAWLSFIVLLLMFVYTYSVFNIAYLN